MKDPIPTFTYFVKKIAEAHPDFAYIHLVEARVSGNMDREVVPEEVSAPRTIPMCPSTRFSHPH